MNDHYNSQTYPAANKCIYCGDQKSKLSEEHIVPFGFGGTSAIDKASCAKCAEATCLIETYAMRGPLWAVRVWLEIQSRTKHADAPKVKKIEVTWPDGEVEKIDLAFVATPLVCSLPIFPLPSLIEPNEITEGIGVKGFLTYYFGDAPESVPAQLEASSVSWIEKTRPAEFARMLAKICYCAAIARGGPDLFEDQPTVVSSILGQTNDIGRWVGTIPFMPPPKSETELHRIELRHDPRDGWVKADIQLFANSGFPVYAVIVGRTAKRFLDEA